MPTPSTVIPLRLLPPAARSTRTAPRPNLLTAASRCDAGAVMRLAHEIARDDVADAAARGRTRRYKVALRDALTSAWITARTQRDCAVRDARMAAIPADHAAIVLERTAALMGIDSGRRMVAEVAMLDRRALAMGVRL